jgi:hypothetical protein
MSCRFRIDNSPALTQLTATCRSNTPIVYSNPPLFPASRPPIRKIIDSAPRSPTLGARAASHHTPALDDGGLLDELVSDMQQQAERINRKRLSKCDTPRMLVWNLMIDDGYVN